MAGSSFAYRYDSGMGEAVATSARWWGLGLGGGQSAGAPGEGSRAEVVLVQIWSTHKNTRTHGSQMIITGGAPTQAGQTGSTSSAKI